MFLFRGARASFLSYPLDYDHEHRQKKKYAANGHSCHQLASLSMNIASIITTVIAFEFVALINAHGHGLDVSARYGEKFLGMTWAAAGLLLVGSIASFVNVFVRETRADEPPPSSSKEEDLEG